jgi:cyclohexyl-isocyanide hydratase
VDFAFTLMSEIAGPDMARAVQLGLEYDPQPPFQSGSPELASEETKSVVGRRYADRLAEFEGRLRRAAPS